MKILNFFNNHKKLILKIWIVVLAVSIPFNDLGLLVQRGNIVLSFVFTLGFIALCVFSLWKLFYNKLDKYFYYSTILIFCLALGSELISAYQIFDIASVGVVVARVIRSLFYLIPIYLLVKKAFNGKNSLTLFFHSNHTKFHNNL